MTTAIIILAIVVVLVLVLQLTARLIEDTTNRKVVDVIAIFVAILAIARVMGWL